MTWTRRSNVCSPFFMPTGTRTGDLTLASHTRRESHRRIAMVLVECTPHGEHHGKSLVQLIFKLAPDSSNLARHLSGLLMHTSKEGKSDWHVASKTLFADLMRVLGGFFRHEH
eukprot:1053294-Pleurochrysis_carterae.AAC.1